MSKKTEKAAGAGKTGTPADGSAAQLLACLSTREPRLSDEQIEARYRRAAQKAGLTPVHRAVKKRPRKAVWLTAACAAAALVSVAVLYPMLHAGQMKTSADNTNAVTTAEEVQREMACDGLSGGTGNAKADAGEGETGMLEEFSMAAPVTSSSPFAGSPSPEALAAEYRFLGTIAQDGRRADVFEKSADGGVWAVLVFVDEAAAEADTGVTVTLADGSVLWPAAEACAPALTQEAGEDSEADAGSGSSQMESGSSEAGSSSSEAKSESAPAFLWRAYWFGEADAAVALTAGPMTFSFG